jgi:WXG100 family type VII secretion target
VSNGNTVYDYGVIEQCNRLITQKVNEMQGTAEELTTDVKRLVEQTWGGQAAGQYEVAADQIRTDLEDRKNTLVALGDRLRTGSENMQETDRKGGRDIEASI